MFLKVAITELGVESTLEQILKMDPPYDVIVHLGSLMDGKLQQFKAVMSNTVELVHAGDYIELDPPFCEVCYFFLNPLIYHFISSNSSNMDSS